MKILEQNETATCTKALKIEMPREEVDQELDGVYKHFMQNATIPGFRTGKVPRKIAELKFGRELYQEAVGKAMEAAFQSAIEELQLKPVSQPKIDEVKDEPEGEDGADEKKGKKDKKDKKDDKTSPIVFEAKFEYMPNLESVEYKDIKIDAGTDEISEKDVVETLNNLRERNASFVSIEERAVADGDLVTISSDATVDGERFEEATHDEITVEIGSGRYLPGFEDELRGMKLDEEKTFTLKITDDHPVEKHRGKDATFNIKIKQIQEKKLPEIDDEFAKDMGNYETLDELKERIREDLKHNQAHRNQQEMRNSLREQLLEHNQFPVPPSLVQNQYQYLQRMADADLRRMGSSLAAATREDEGLLAQYEKRAEDDVRMSAILQLIAEKESVAVSDEEYMAHVQRSAQTHGADPNWFLRRIQDSGLEEHFRKEATEEKVMNEMLVKLGVGTPEEEADEDVEDAEVNDSDGDSGESAGDDSGE